MTNQTVFLDDEKKVSLTSYLLDPSEEMKPFRTRPAVLIFPGGAYKFCSDREAEPIAMAFLAEGYHAFILRYSLNENSVFPRPLQDAEQALRLIRENAESYGVDAQRIAVIGFSAGGHLAAALGTMGEVRPDAMILGYPCILESIGDILASPIPSLDREVDEKTPPCFLFATYGDSTVPVENSLEFASALNRQKVPFELHIFTNGDHGLSLAKPHTANGNPELINDRVGAWMPMCVSWLRTVLMWQ